MKYISLLSPVQVLKMIAMWPPFLAQGISVKSINKNVTVVVVEKKTNFWNQNYFGTHFGGSLYSMCDPFYVFILAHHLKKDHVIWDIGAEIKFIKAIKEPVTVRFEIDEYIINSIKEQCLSNFKYEPSFSTEIVNKKGETIASVTKKLYVRRKDAKERFSKNT